MTAGAYFIIAGDLEHFCIFGLKYVSLKGFLYVCVEDTIGWLKYTITIFPPCLAPNTGFCVGH